jgi:hypothetical protein
VRDKMSLEDVVEAAFSSLLACSTHGAPVHQCACPSLCCLVLVLPTPHVQKWSALLHVYGGFHRVVLNQPIIPEVWIAPALNLYAAIRQVSLSKALHVVSECSTAAPTLLLVGLQL